MLGNDLINGISEQDWDIQLKDNGNCCQYDTEDQQKTVFSDETQYFKKVSLLLLLAGSFIVDLLIQSPPSLYYLQIQRSIWLFLPETERSRFPGKYHRYAAVQHEYPYLPEYRYQGQGSGLPAECWRNAGIPEM